MAAGPRRLLRTPPLAALLLAVIRPVVLGAQAPMFEMLDQQQGLGPAPVWALAQDSVGFVWIGAEGEDLRAHGLPGLHDPDQLSPGGRGPGVGAIRLPGFARRHGSGLPSRVGVLKTGRRPRDPGNDPRPDPRGRPVTS
jgi:hypothetical protein